MIFNDFRSSRMGVVSQVLGISALIAILFVTGCNTTGGGSAQFSVMTTSASLPAGSISTGAAYPSTALTANAGTAPYTWAVTTGNLPTGLTLSPAGMISGTPTASGTFAFTVTATDSATPAHTATASLSITINGKLTITSAGTLSTVGAAGSAYSATISATGGVGPFTWAVNTGNLPTGLGLSGTTGTGTISGTISASAAPGSYNFTAKITDSQGGVGISGTITITVDAAVVINPPTFPVGVVGLNYTSPAFTATGGSGTGYSYALAGGSIAPLVLNANTGIISGTPTSTTTLQFSVKVTDSLGFTATASGLSITINAAITVALSPASPVTLDQGKTQLVTATVGNDPNSAGVNWSAVTGLGSLTGSTTGATTYNAPASVGAASIATFTATSKTDPTKSATYTVNLVPPPQITTTTMAAGNLNGVYSSAVSMSGGVAPYTWAIVAAPAGLTLSNSTTSTVTVQGTPTVAGANQTFTIKVTDAQGLSVTSSGLTITIYPTLTIAPPVLPVGVATVSYSSPAFTAAGGSGAGYTFAIASGSVSPLVIGSASGIISGTPTTAGTLKFTVKVTDSVGNVATTALLGITINPAITVVLSPTGPVTLDQGKSQLVTATVSNDPNSAGVNWSAVSGLGTLTGQTTTSATYNAPVTVTVASSATFTAASVTDPTKLVTFTVNLVPPPQITTTTMAAGNVNGPYTSPVSASGGVAPFTWAIVAAPAGLTLSGSTTSTVTVQGAPTVAGPNQIFTIKVTDAQGLSVTSSGLTITVYSALVLTPPSLPLPTGAVGVNYPATETFTASGGSGTGYTWSIVAGNPLPTGLSLSTAAGTSTSITAGPPTAAGTFPFTVKLTDSVGNAATTTGLSIVINPPINITLAPVQPFAMDQNTSQLITATVSNDPNSAGVTWSTLTGLGSLSGSTTTTITYNAPVSIASPSIATFTATSVTDPTKSASFSVSLEPPPLIATPTFPAGTVGASYSSPVTLNGGVGPYTWSFTALPAGLTLSSSTTNTVNVTGTPTTAGASQTVTIKATDAKGLSNTLNTTITVTNNSGQISGQISLTNTCGSVTLPTFTVTINTTPAQQVQTDTNGNYSFASIPNGTYTITPSISGAASSVFSPASYTGVVVNSGSVSGENFNAVVGYNISGNVSYTGSQTGQTYLYLQSNNCGGNGGPGTSITQATLGSGGAYTIHGVQPGNYTLNAWMDSTGVTSGPKYPGGQGQPNENDPTGSNSSVSVTTASVTGVGVTMSSPTYSTPSSNPAIQVFPSAGGVAIFYQPPTVSNANGNKEEDANEYVVQWAVTTGTDGLGNPTCALGGGTGGAQFLTVAGSHTFYAMGAHGGNVWILNNTMAGAGTFTSGQSYCFQARAFNTLATTTHPSGWGNYADSSGSPLAVKIGSALCSSNCTTVSGTVTIPSGVTPASGAPLYVGFYQQSGSSNGPTALYATEISGPITGANSYSITIPSGSNYYIFGILDQNNDGQIDAGDVTDTNNNNNNSSGITVSGSTMTVNDNSLPATNSTATVQTQYSTCGTNCSSYNLNLQVREGNKLPVAVTLYSGPNLLDPVDMGQCSSCGSIQFQYSASLPGGTPIVGDTYNFTVTYSDGSVDQGSAGTINGKVTAFGSTGAVVGANDVPTNLLPSGTSSTSTTPNFTWTFPSSPSNYTYSFYLQQNNCSGNCNIWQIPGQNSNSNGFTYAQTQTGATTGQITWGTDPTGATNSPSVSTLTVGATYYWSISVQDANSNQAQGSVNYAP